MKSFNTKIIAVSNQKGGVGKTTSAINIASFLAITETPTLLIDMDPQANASSGLGININDHKSIYDIMINNVSIKKCILKTKIDYLDIIPSHTKLSGAEIELVSMFTRESILKDALQSILGKYKYIIIDTPPSLGLLTINVLTASKSLIIPIQCEYYALEGLSQLLNTIRLVQKNLNPELNIEGILLTMSDKRNSLSSLVEKDERQHFGDQVYKTTIPRNVKISAAPSHGKPALVYDTQAAGSLAYIELAKEVILNQNKIYE